MFKVWGLGFRVSGPASGVSGFGLRKTEGSGFRDRGIGFAFGASGDAGLRVWVSRGLNRDLMDFLTIWNRPHSPQTRE